MTEERPLDQGDIHAVLQEEDAWVEISRELLGPEPELLRVSPYVGDSRIYVGHEKLAKIRSLRAALPHGMKSLAFESVVIRKLGRPVDYFEDGVWEALITDRLEAESFQSWLARASMRKRLQVLWHLMPQLAQVHKAGFAHGDLSPENVIISKTGQPILVDFDRAVSAQRLLATLIDWFGFPLGETKPLWVLFALTLVPRSRSLSRRIKGLISQGRTNSIQGPADLRLLNEAWNLGRSSPANARGQSLAYYAMSYKGHHFPGERPWHLRWEEIRTRVDLHDKTILELGCNMGLLSTFSLLHGARSAFGIDADPVIVDAAKIVAEAMGVEPTFQVLDLSDSEDWEARLPRCDVVTALSLIHWLDRTTQDRVLRFLGTYQELIYEGHESLDDETQRLRTIGFEDIECLRETERGRYLLYAQKHVIAGS